MKKFILLLLLFSALAYSQMPNISQVWLNNSHPFTGTISGDKMPLKLKVNISEQDRKNDQEYFIAGYSLVDKTYTKFEGKLKITKYKAGKKTSLIFGDYVLDEENKGPHSGIFTGKFIYTFIWNKKSQKIDQQFLEFTGNWKSYDGKLDYRTTWKN